MSKKSSKKQRPVDDKHVKTDDELGPVSKTAKGEICIKVQAKPGSKFNAVTEMNVESVCIQISAPPVDGEANATLIKYVSTVLGVRKSDVSLDKGSKSRCKVLNVTGNNLTVEDVKSKLQQAIEENR